MKLAFATIGESPRDDLVPYLRETLPATTEVLEAGVLDGLTDEEITELFDPSLPLNMVTKRSGGRSAKLSHQLVLPKMQIIVDEFNRQDVDLIVILCGADWSTIHSKAPLMNLGSLFPNLLKGIAGTQRLGMIKPAQGQVERTAEQFTQMGMNTVVTSAFPYDEHRLEAARAAAAYLAPTAPSMIWMSCVGMNEDMRQVVQEETGVPVILARSILRKVIEEVV